MFPEIYTKQSIILKCGGGSIVFSIVHLVGSLSNPLFTRSLTFGGLAPPWLCLVLSICSKFELLLPLCVPFLNFFVVVIDMYIF